MECEKHCVVCICPRFSHKKIKHRSRDKFCNNSYTRSRVKRWCSLLCIWVFWYKQILIIITYYSNMFIRSSFLPFIPNTDLSILLSYYLSVRLSVNLCVYTTVSLYCNWFSYYVIYIFVKIFYKMLGSLLHVKKHIQNVWFEKNDLPVNKYISNNPNPW